MLEPLEKRRYATGPRRVRAAVADGTVFLVIAFLALYTADSVDSLALGRGALVLATVLITLYEPILVSRTGRTLGHRLARLRVARESSDAPPGFIRAWFRAVLKAALGLPSLFLMAVTRRHQAIHDRVTKTVVLIHDRAGAMVADYHVERLPAELHSDVSRLRRLIVMAIYCVAVVAAAILGLIPFVSSDCALHDQCSQADDRAFSISGIVMMLGCGITMVQGWRGRLPGARPRRQSSRATRDE